MAFLQTKGYMTLDEAGVIGVSQQARTITGVAPGSPAHAAGIRIDDVITDVDGQPIRSGKQVRRMILSGPPASRISLTVLRDGDLITFDMARDSYRRVFGNGARQTPAPISAGAVGR